MKLIERFNNQENIVLGYLGGSITEGAGASCDENNYRSLITKWFRETFPDKKIDEVNAGIGGTGSDLGVFRVERDILSKDLDVVFVEFAVNDYKTPCDRCMNSMEGIVRKILKKNSKTLIFFLYTITKQMISECYRKNKTPPSILSHSEIADYYNIPTINVGKMLWKEAESKKLDITAFLPDEVHPNDEGYKVYASKIIELLPYLEWNIQYKEAPCSNENYETATLVMAETLANDMWIKSDKSMMNRLENYIYSNHIEAELKFPFEGSIIGIYWTIEKDSGNILYSIDDSEYKEVSSWDKYALQFGRVCNVILDDCLENGKHTLHLIISDKKEDLSQGFYIRIGAFLSISK